MAITQISLIQIRRGQESISGIPQLASGEMGWAIDTQKLYIGNGDLSEGAPEVGNTEILTEHSDILSLANQYQYEVDNTAIQTGPSTATPISRSIQDRLDDLVTLPAFGANPQFGVTIVDDTALIQRALDQLFANSVPLPVGAIELLIPAGYYYISSALNIPPNTNIRGAGIDKTFIIQTGNDVVFNTVDTTGNGLNNLTSTIKNITITGITFQNNTIGYSVANLNAIENCIFEEVKFVGSWTLSTVAGSDFSVSLNGLNSTINCFTNIFERCHFIGNSYGIISQADISNNRFHDCKIKTCNIGIYFDNTASGSITGPINNSILNTTFDYIYNQGIYINYGYNNLSQSNRFLNVGTGNTTSGEINTSNIITFNQLNTSTNDYFYRTFTLNQTPTLAFLGEYSGHVIGDNKFCPIITIVATNSSTSILNFTNFGSNLKYKIHYIYSGSNFTRDGIFTIITKNTYISYSDEYDVVGNISNIGVLPLTASLSGNTISISYINSTSSDIGSISYWYEVAS